MKNILFFILAAVAFPVSSLDIADELIGSWRVSPVLIELEDGTLVSPDAAYAYPYTGINEITFLDSGFVVFKAGGIDYRAFYEIESLDFDNFHVRCMFRDGEEFLLKLVREKDSFGILYRITSDSILKGPAVESSGEEPAELPAEEDAVMMGADSVSGEIPAAEEIAESLYAGVLIRK